MVRSPITEEASNPNEQASAQIPSHEFRARDLLRMITSHKEQDIILAGGACVRRLLRRFGCESKPPQTIAAACLGLFWLSSVRRLSD
jgi:hypothetical protein